MSDFVWEDPPSAARGGVRGRVSKWQTEADELRNRSKEWALLSIKQTRGAATSMANDIDNGILHAFKPAGSFEATTRTVGSEYRVYARYVGEMSGR